MQNTEFYVQAAFADDWTGLCSPKSATLCSLKLCHDLKKVLHLNFKSMNCLAKDLERLVSVEKRINKSGGLGA